MPLSSPQAQNKFKKCVAISFYVFMFERNGKAGSKEHDTFTSK
jgi:hypothetical protein